ncbi:Probable 2-oxoglutarate-dependent dioxygenase AOP1.2 [Linum grandiflorum]
MKAGGQSTSPGDSWNSVSSQVLEAVQEHGCFQARFQDFPEELLRGIHLASQEAFSQPLQAKQRNVSDKPFHGYIGSSKVLPFYESLGIDDPENPDSFTNAIWPHGNPKFSKIVGSFSRKLADLEKTVRRMILERLGVEKYMEEQNHVDGLQIQTKDGVWINLRFSPHCFLVLMGESFNAWTNGRLQCPYHRVMLRGDEARLSAALFSIPKQGFLVKAPQELVDEQHPLLFKPYDYIDYLHLRFKDSAESPLHVYFGKSIPQNL